MRVADEKTIDVGARMEQMLNQLKISNDLGHKLKSLSQKKTLLLSQSSMKVHQNKSLIQGLEMSS